MLSDCRMIHVLNTDMACFIINVKETLVLLCENMSTALGPKFTPATGIKDILVTPLRSMFEQQYNTLKYTICFGIMIAMETIASIV